MKKTTATGLVSLPYNYGVSGKSKPYPKMIIHGWTTINDDQILTDLYYKLHLVNRWAYQVNIEIVDMVEGTDIAEIRELFVIIQAVVLADNDREGTNWFCEKAFINSDSADKCVKDMEEKRYGFFWVQSCSQ